MQVFLKGLALIGLGVLSTGAYAQFDPGQPTLLITGANRGIGLEFVNQYAAKGWNIIATARNPKAAEALRKKLQQLLDRPLLPEAGTLR